MTVIDPDAEMIRPRGLIGLFFDTRPLLRDSLVAALLLVISTAPLLTVSDTPFEAAHWALLCSAVVLLLVAVLPSFGRHRHPWLAASASMSAIVVSVWVPSAAVVLPVFFALYFLATRKHPMSAWTAAAAAELLAISASVVGHALVPSVWNATTILGWSLQFAICSALGVALGTSIRTRRQYLEALVERARRLEQERDQQAQNAAAAERARIAREMHDIISHSLTVMVTLTEGAAVALDGREERATRAIQRAADTGREAMTDMRRMLGVLGSPGPTSAAALTPQPGLADLPELIARSRASGLPVRLEITGAVPADSTLQLALYRIAQESLTNTLRYAADASEVVVALGFDHHEATLTVTDDGSRQTAAGKGSGRGLIGLAERAGVLGGSVAAGPQGASRGWRVRASIPLQMKS
jgi:signal transduction histidine kinase